MMVVLMITISPLNSLDRRKVIAVIFLIDFFILEKTTKVFMKDVIESVLKKDIKKTVIISNDFH